MKKKENYGRFAKNLRYLRKKSNITQAALAKEFGVSASTVAGWEQRRFDPSLVMLINISRYFEISIDALLTDALEDQYRRKAIRALAMKPVKKEFVTDQKELEKRYACPHCGEEYSERSHNDGRFCKFCGQEIKKIK